MKIAAIPMMMLCCSAAAQPFIEFGLGAPTGGCIYRYYKTSESDPVCSEKPLGLAAVGWRLPYGFSVQLDHWSSLATTKDRGLEILSVRWRWEFKD